MRRNQHKAENRTDSWSGMFQTGFGSSRIYSWVFQTKQTAAIDPSGSTHVGQYNFYRMFTNCESEDNDKKQHSEL